MTKQPHLSDKDKLEVYRLHLQGTSLYHLSEIFKAPMWYLDEIINEINANKK